MTAAHAFRRKDETDQHAAEDTRFAEPVRDHLAIDLGSRPADRFQRFRHSLPTDVSRRAYLPIIGRHFSSERMPLRPPGAYALSFDGVDDILVIHATDPAVDQLSTQATFESWILVKSIKNFERIIDRSDDDGYDRFLLTLDHELMGVDLNLNRSVVRANALPLGEWVHVAATYDGEMQRVYINGELGAELGYSGAIDVTTPKMSIGNNLWNNRQFHGFIMEVRIWSVARTETEIRETLTTRLTGQEPDLLAYWPMREGRGQRVHDLAGSSTGELGLSSCRDRSDPRWISVQQDTKHPPRRPGR